MRGYSLGCASRSAHRQAPERKQHWWDEATAWRHPALGHAIGFSRCDWSLSANRADSIVGHGCTFLGL